MIIEPKTEIPNLYYTGHFFTIYLLLLPGNKGVRCLNLSFPDFAWSLTSNTESLCSS